MSALASLSRAYDRLYARHEVPAFGYSFEKIGFLISLNTDGTPAGRPIDLREPSGKKLVPRSIAVPQPAKRTSGISPNFLWDKTAYSLGITASQRARTKDEHTAFVRRHVELLHGSNDAGLKALLGFISTWRPEDFGRFDWPEEMKDQNVVFALESERRQNVSIHDRPAARALWARISAETQKAQAICLVDGTRSPVARLHPAIKGVWGGQSSGGSIVSFNLDAFESYDHSQGENAPVSEAAAFAYTTALNRFLANDSGHRIQIGDASTVFWAEASDNEQAIAAEDVFSQLMSPDGNTEAKRIGAILARIRSGRPAEEIRAELPKNVTFHVLGLSPNAARISVRFYLENEFGDMAERIVEHMQRLWIEPAPREQFPSVWRLLIETAVQRKTENIAPNLAGEWIRAILTGNLYPLSLLATLNMRMRADHDVNALRVAIIKSVLIRNFGMEVKVALDPDNREPGYLLGRLFATYEQIQSAALGRNVNATVKDKFYGAAVSQPRKIFPLLDKGSKSHLSKVGRDRRGYQVNLEKAVAEIFNAMTPGDDPFPSHLPDRQQGLFALGYYHQRNKFFPASDKSESEGTAQ